MGDMNEKRSDFIVDAKKRGGWRDWTGYKTNSVGEMGGKEGKVSEQRQVRQSPWRGL